MGRMMTVVGWLMLCVACRAPASPKPDEENVFIREGDARLQVEAFGYWGGSYRWAGPISELAASQRDVLSNVRALEDVDDTCVQDVLEFTLTVVDSSGNTRRAIANEMNSFCAQTEQKLAYDRLAPFLATLGCVGTGESGAEIANAPGIRGDDGCSHGFFVMAQPKPQWVKVTATHGGRNHRFELVGDCGGFEGILELYDATGATSLVQSTAPTPGSAACPSLEASLESGVGYALKVSLTPATSGGHALLNVTSTDDSDFRLAQGDELKRRHEHPARGRCCLGRCKHHERVTV